MCRKIPIPVLPRDWHQTEQNVRSCLLLAVVLAALTGVSETAQASQIYLLKGLAGIFSTGLDVLDQELLQRGYDDASVHSYSEYDTLAAEAAELERKGKGPIIIIGHSLGANAAIDMAARMAELRAPVALIVSFGPTVNLVAPPNVAQIINYYTGDYPIKRGPGFRGSLSNIDLNNAPGINHLNIEKIESLHAIVIGKIGTVVAHAHGGGPAAPAGEPASHAGGPASHAGGPAARAGGPAPVH